METNGLPSVLFAAILLVTSAHFTMTWPPSRMGGSMSSAGTCRGDCPSSVPQNGTCLWYNKGCYIGCDRCDGGGGSQGKGCTMPSQPIQPTLPDRFRSWPDVNSYATGGRGTCGSIQAGPDPFKFNPWRAPGRAPVMSPCGLAGGSDTFNRYGGYPPAGVQQGLDGRHLRTREKVEWVAGSNQEVAVSVVSNHGGGYAFRLCPKPDASHIVTEECFQQNHLRFVGDIQWVQWGNNKQSRVAVPAMRIDEGTHPPGSQWTRFPMPACGGTFGGDGAGGSDVPGRIQAGPQCNRTQFEPPVPGLFGYGMSQCVLPNSDTPSLYEGARNCTENELESVAQLFNVNFVDMVEVPADLPAGNYVLSWRHDCEQTPEVFATCADITVTSKVSTLV